MVLLILVVFFPTIITFLNLAINVFFAGQFFFLLFYTSTVTKLFLPLGDYNCYHSDHHDDY